MALCLNCGKNIDIVARECPYCHTPITEDSITNKSAVKGYGKRSFEGVALVKTISILLPFLGFIFYFKDRDNYSAPIFLVYSMIGTIVYLAIITLLIIKFVF